MATERTTGRGNRPRIRTGTGALLGLGLGAGLGLAALPVAGMGQLPHAPAADGARSTFNASDYDLAWQAFLGAGKLADATALAEKALTLQPDSVLWHRRLASVAEQDGNTVLAARQYAWLATEGRQGDLLEHAIDLSNATQQNDTAIRLMLARAAHEPFNQDHWTELLDSMLDIGRFDQALAVLAAADHQHPGRYFLQQQAEVLALAGRADDRVAALRKLIVRYGADPQTSLQLAAAEYTRGHLQPALDTLRQALPNAMPADTLYWQTLGSLAWMLQDFHTAARASQTLVGSGKARAADYAHLYRLHVAHDPAVAYAYALTGWRETHAEPLFFQAAAAASQLDRPALLGSLFKAVRPADRRALETQPQYWVRWAQLARLEGNDSEAFSRYAQALQRAPGDAGVLAGFVWLLIDTHDPHLLRRLVDRMVAAPTDPELRAALVSALALLDQPARALAWMRPDLASHRNDADWLMQYADLLEQADQGELAQAMRLAAVPRLQRPTPAAPTAAAARRRKQRVALSGRLAPGDPTARAIAPLVRHPDDGAAREQVLAWTLALDSPEATALWLTRQYRDTPAPVWARLSQSLASDDDTATMQLLLADADRLPRRDRVTAAEKLGWNPLASSLAYRGLQGEADDRQLAMQFQKLAIAQANALGTTLAGRHSSGLQSIDSGMTSRTWLTHALSLDIEAHHVQQRVYDTSQLDGVPVAAQFASVVLTEHLPRGDRGLSLGGGHDLAGYGQLGAFYRYRLWRSLQLGVQVDVGARTDDTVLLSIGGLTDRLKTSAAYQWTARDSLSATATAGHLRAQGGGSLGARQSIDLEYRHKLWLAPPDFTLLATATDARYQHAASLPQALTRLLPAGQPADPGLVVPRSYTQICAGAAFNENYRTDWSDQPRLFGDASACHNSVSGAGASLNFGLAMPLIGPDHFSFALGYSSNTGPSGSRSLNMLLNYRYYFTP